MGTNYAFLQQAAIHKVSPLLSFLRDTTCRHNINSPLKLGATFMWPGTRTGVKMSERATSVQCYMKACLILSKI